VGDGFEPSKGEAQLIYSQSPLATWVTHRTKGAEVRAVSAVCQEEFCASFSGFRVPSRVEGRTMVFLASFPLVVSGGETLAPAGFELRNSEQIHHQAP
jgi:hypothetical protein